MNYSPGQNFYASFATNDITGTPANADSTPTSGVYRNGSFDGAVTVTVASAGTGLYVASGTVPIGYAAGDTVEILIGATVSGVSGQVFVSLGTLIPENFQLLQIDSVSGAMGVDVTYVGGADEDLPTASSISTLQTSVDNLTNLSSLANLRGPALLVIPASGSETYLYTLTVNNTEGQLVDLTASPTLSAYNAAGTSRNANLSAVTHVSTGTYTFTYTVQSTAAEESLTVKASGTASGDSTSRVAYSAGTISATDTANAIENIETTVNGIAAGTTPVTTSNPYVVRNTTVVTRQINANPTP